MTQKEPKRMKEYPVSRTITWLDDETGQEIGRAEYLHIDHALALVAAAYEDAGDAAADVYERRDLPTGADLAEYIRTIATDDAQAALERVKMEEREITMRRCTHYCTDCGHVVPVDENFRGSCGHGRVYDTRPQALDKILQEARNEALREASEAVHYECWTDGNQDQVTPELLAEQATTSLAIRAIEGLITEDQSDDG